MDHLNGRVAIVTGASSGIGAAAARALAAAGMTVVLAARTAERLEALAAEIGSAGGTAVAQPVDLTREADVLALFEAADRLGGPDLLVNNAGVADHTEITGLSLERWNWVMEANLTSAFLCSREAFIRMKAKGHGRIINVGSISARMPRQDCPAYTASKFALEGLTRALALDGRAHGITVSIVHPGSTATAIEPGAAPQPAERQMQADSVARVILTVAGLPDEVNLLESVVLPIAQPFLGRG